LGREKSKLALRNALDSQKQLALFAQLEPDTEDPGIADLLSMGVVAKLLDHREYPNDVIKVVVEGQQRIYLSEVISFSPQLLIKPGTVQEEDSGDDIGMPSKKTIREGVSSLLKNDTKDRFLREYGLPYDADPGLLADSLIQRLETEFSNQVKCLLELNPRKRLKFAYEVLIKEAYSAELESKINEQVTLEIKDAHKEIFLRGQLKVILEQLGENAPLSLYNPIFRGRNFKVNPKSLFVLMPFKEEFRPIYSEIIKPVAEQFGLDCVRADDLYSTKAIMEDVWKLINEAKIIVADLTGKNPNVFYEAGLAHAVGKDVIIISQNIDDVPFDLRHLRVFIYQDSVAGFRKLEKQLYQALSNIDGLVKPAAPS
jgi:hypothetical protein